MNSLRECFRLVAVSIYDISQLVGSRTPAQEAQDVDSNITLRALSTLREKTELPLWAPRTIAIAISRAMPTPKVKYASTLRRTDSTSTPRMHNAHDAVYPGSRRSVRKQAGSTQKLDQSSELSGRLAM